MADRFLIAPYDKDIINVIFGINKINTKGCILKKQYKKRKDTIDLTGQTFYDLKVLEYAGPGKYRGATFLCECKCGKRCIIPGGHLRSDKRKSCGCRSEARIDEVGVNRLFSCYKRKARLRNLSFNLPRDIFEKLVKSNCTYCGTEPNQILKRLKSRKLQTIYNGIDRVNSDIGYEIDNCVACCRYCNQSKSDLSLDQWKTYIKRIYSWLQIDSI